MKLDLECWHKTLNDKDEKVGTTQISFAELLKSPVHQVDNIFVKKSIKYYELKDLQDKFLASLQIRIYLEDLGQNYEEPQ